MLTAKNPAVREYLTVMETRDGNVKVDVRNIRQTYPLKHKYGYLYCGSKMDTSEYDFY